ncbi:MAG: hypothetical protein ACO2O5_05105 [Candidatus Caldipriscus sp.]
MRVEDSERFRHILRKLERWDIPMAPIGRDNRIKGLLVVKVEMIREFLALVGSDLLYDAYISKERVLSLEDGRWDVEVVKMGPKLYAVWKIGLESRTYTGITDVKKRFLAMLKEYEEGRYEES